MSINKEKAEKSTKRKTGGTLMNDMKIGYDEILRCLKKLGNFFKSKDLSEKKNCMGTINLMYCQALTNH
jgi:hypothetical protein